MHELSALVRRDHDDLHYALRVLSEPLSDDVNVSALLERVRTTLPAHAEAEFHALAAIFEHTQAPPELYFLASQVMASHLSQEEALENLLAQRIGTVAFRERARYLRQLVANHADHEAACFHPALCDHLPRPLFEMVGAIYAAERERISLTPALREVG